MNGTAEHRIRNAIVGGSVFFVAGPVIGATIIATFWCFREKDFVHEWIAGMELCSLCAFIMGYWIPAALTGAIMGRFGVRYSRKRTVCSGIFTGICVTAIYNVVIGFIISPAENFDYSGTS